jgi:hypothetical protein
MSIKLLAAALVFAGFATCASADITWTLSDITFNNGDAVTGSFMTNDAIPSSTMCCKAFATVGAERK